MDLNYLKEKLDAAMEQHPSRAAEIRELLYMAQDEIDDGESMENEVELALGSLQEIIEEENSK